MPNPILMGFFALRLSNRRERRRQCECHRKQTGKQHYAHTVFHDLGHVLLLPTGFPFTRNNVPLNDFIRSRHAHK